MTDTEELLKAGMGRFTSDVRVPAGLPAKAARRVRRRRVTVTASVTATASAAVVAGVAIALNAGPAPAPPSASARTDAYVISHTEAALAGLTQHNTVEYDRITTSGKASVEFAPGVVAGTVAVWTYHGRGRWVSYTSLGQIAGDDARADDGRQITETLVDYRNKTWWRETSTVPAFPGVTPTPESACDEATVVIGGGIGIRDLATQLRAALSCGLYRVAGTRQVDGVRAIELAPVQRNSVVSTVFWVDPASYLPVRDVEMLSTGGRIQEDFQWLPPTTANLANLNAVIPAGFTQVAPS